MTWFDQLRFMESPLTLCLSVLAVVATAGVSYYGWSRSGFAKGYGFQELLRLLIVVVIAVLINQPEWVEDYRPDQKPTIAVLWDQSDSMQTVDVIDPGAKSAAAISRAEAIRPLTETAVWQSLAERLDVVVQPIAAPAPGRGSDLNQPLIDVVEKVSQLMGVVVISDGDWNDGRPPVEAASRLRMKDVPLFAVAAGSPTRLPDVELISMDLPTFATVGKPVRIPLTIDSALPREFVTTLTLTASDGQTLSKDVRIGAMGRTSDAITWTPTEVGDYTVTVDVPAQASEAITTNNSVSAPIAIRQEKLKVLVIESAPRWEYRYLRNALSRDPGVDVSCLLFHPGLDKVGGGSSDYLKAFPEELEDLAKYDVVFLGDVGIDDNQLTPEQCELIKGLVEQQASGLVFLPGLQGRQLSLAQTALDDLLPVVTDPAQPGGWGSRTPGHFALTERGRTSLLTKLADTAGDNVDVWEGLPGFQWYAPVMRAKAGSDVLAVHGEMSNQYGRLPLLVTRTFGAGKVLFMGTDGAWRWRKGVEDKYHYRFWGQVVRWMAYQRNMAKGETMRLFYTPDQPTMRQSMTLHAHVMDDGGEPLQSGDVIARITTPDGGIETVRLVAEGGQWGVFRGRYVPELPGEHQVTLACQQASATLDAKFFVQGQALEQIGKPARPDVLQELAMVTRGKMVEPSGIGEIVDLLADLPMPPPTVHRLELWSHPLTALLVVLLLAVFWVWRKSLGLI